MKLRDLNPRWIHQNLFVFKCPCSQCSEGEAVWLTCKNAPMEERMQHELYEQVFGEDWNLAVVPCRPDFAWTISGQDFSTISVNPSIDASPSGHWHGSIVNGEIH